MLLSLSEEVQRYIIAILNDWVLLDLWGLLVRLMDFCVGLICFLRIANYLFNYLLLHLFISLSIHFLLSFFYQYIFLLLPVLNCLFLYIRLSLLNHSWSFLVDYVRIRLIFPILSDVLLDFSHNCLAALIIGIMELLP